MGKLVQEYNRKLWIYLQKKHGISKKSESERKNRVLKFLAFCENLGVQRIQDIIEQHYRAFVESVLVNLSTETKRKYLLALREFFDRAHLNIKINVQRNVKTTKNKKLQRILKILGITEISDQQKNELLKLL
jgi:site-specific recombinase XerD